MANVIKLRKGLNINLKGSAAESNFSVVPSGEIGLVPDGFVGVTPKVAVHAGDKVKAGDALFFNKRYPNVKFSSPVSGTVKEVVRGDRRKVLAITVTADATQDYVDFGKKDVKGMKGSDVVSSLLDAGLFGYINQLPYAVSTNPEKMPKSIFVSALRDMPLAADFLYELKGNEKDFTTGITALSKIAKTYLGIGRDQESNSTLTSVKDAEVTVFDGKCPAGNVGVHVNHLDPVNKGEVVWTVDPSVVIFIGRLFNTGHVDLRRTIALAGSEVKSPAYCEVMVGEKVGTVTSGRISTGNVRVINGNVLTGCRCTAEDYILPHTSEINVIPEGNDVDEFAGWIMPRFGQFSTSRSYFSWLLGKNKEYTLDARIKGGERHMIMSGEYDKVLPMDIYGEFLIKAIITGDLDRMEALGIYEVSPEDFALAEFVDSSKLELQKIVRNGLDQLRKENE